MLSAGVCTYLAPAKFQGTNRRTRSDRAKDEDAGMLIKFHTLDMCFFPDTEQPIEIFSQHWYTQLLVVPLVFV